MLRSAILNVEHIAPSLDATIGRGRAPGAEAKQRLKGNHGLFASIVPKDELVQVHLQLRAADAVVGADQPVLEVPDGAVRKGHDGGGTLAKRRTPRLRAGDVPEARSVQAGESRQPGLRMAVIVVALTFGRTPIRSRPERSPRLSTATRMGTARRSFNGRLPLSPG
jgi:hypothetical protein